MVAVSVPPRRKLRRAEYDQMVAIGLFRGEHVELFRGELVAMSPIGCPHSAVVTRLYRLRDRAIAPGLVVRCQQPLICADESEPEPDLAVVPDGALELAHPTVAPLVIEVADSSLAYDLGAKAALYAESRVDEYWVLDLEHRQIVVHQGRGPDNWTSIVVHPADAPVAPACAPSLTVTLDALLTAS